MFLNPVSSGPVYVLLLHKSNHYRAAVCVGALKKLYSFIMHPARSRRDSSVGIAMGSFSQRPDRLWGTPSLLSSTGGKAAGA
jgi:hypothetical protein